MNFKEIAIEAAKKAGKKQLELAHGIVKYTMKSRHDIQSEADLASEKIILDMIRKNFPDHSLLAEESGDNGAKSDYLWVIDPLDGTINYARVIEDSCVSIGLEHKGDIILGVIYNPALDQLFVAERGEGATVNGREISVSDKRITTNMLIATDTANEVEMRDSNFEILRRVCTDFQQVRIMGSSAMHLARLARGQLDVHYRTNFIYWDFVAGILLVEEAGGKVTDFSGDPINKNSKDIVVSNNQCHEQILELLNKEM
jgi:myo-inositol-1(or 4)-monophosphatase